jgi:hypothetical protein
MMQQYLVFQNQGPIDEMPGQKTSRCFHVAVHDSKVQQEDHSVHCSYKTVHYSIFLPAGWWLIHQLSDLLEGQLARVISR